MSLFCVKSREKQILYMCVCVCLCASVLVCVNMHILTHLLIQHSVGGLD
jgi:hypothetical protein